MQIYEIATLSEQAWRHDRGSWERARLISYVTAQCQSSKSIKATDLLTFPWDIKDEEDAPVTSMSEADRQRLTEMALEYEKNLANG